MIIISTPENIAILDRLLDPDDPVLLESDRNRRIGDLTDLARILIRTARSMTPEQKAEMREPFTKFDRKLLRRMDICS